MAVNKRGGMPRAFPTRAKYLNHLRDVARSGRGFSADGMVASKLDGRMHEMLVSGYHFNARRVPRDPDKPRAARHGKACLNKGAKS